MEEDNLEKIPTVTPEEVGKALGKSAELIRAGLRQNKFPFGTAIQGKTGQWNYIIIKSKFLEFAGIKEVRTNEDM